MDLANTIQILTITFSAITLVFLLYQSKVQTTTTKNQIYQNFVNNSLEIDRMFVAHPEFRAYIYGNKEIKPEEVDIELLMSATELFIDAVENIYVFEDDIPKNRRDGWLKFAKQVESSSAYAFYLKNNGEWYEVEGGEPVTGKKRDSGNREPHART